MAKGFICVEVGDRIVKVSVATGVEKKRKVRDAFFFEASSELVDDGQIEDTARFSSALKSELENHKCSDMKEVVFTVASTKIATREVRMPVLTDSKIENVIETNKSSYFPMDLDEHNVMYRVMSRDKKGPDKGANVLVIAMPNGMIEACAKVAADAGLKLKGVDAACSCLADGVLLLKQSQIMAYVNVEATNTNIWFMKGSELLLQRSLSFGGDELIEAYRDKSDSDLSYLEALNDLTGIAAEDNIDGKLTEDDITALLYRVVGNISRSVEFFDNNKGGGVTQIVMMGTCGDLLGMADMLSESTQIPTMHMTQLSTAAPLRSISHTPAYYMSMMYAGASGLNFGAEFEPKNQKGKRSTGKTEVDMGTVALIFMLMLVFAVYWGYSAVVQHADMEAQLKSLNAEIDTMDYVDDVTELHKYYKDSKDTLLNFTLNTMNPNENLVVFLAELEAKMPEELLIMSAACTAQSVSMNLVVNSMVEAATVVSKLRSFESIGSISVSGLGMQYIQFEGEEYSQALQEGFEEVSFSVVCTYGTNPYTSNINPYAGILGVTSTGSTAE